MINVFSLQRLLAMCWLLCLLMFSDHALAGKVYVDNGDGTVTDPTTGLTWMRCAMGQTWDGVAETCTGSASTYTWDQANALTGAVTYAGQSDWRVPNIRELTTIVDRSVVNPAIDASAFPGTPSSDFWSGSPDVHISSDAWRVHFYDGGTSSGYQSYDNAVRLVRAGQSLGLLDINRPTADYVDQGNGTVMHTPTRLIWQRCAMGQSWSDSTCTGTASNYTWDDAKLLTSALAGETDWRLPTEDELLSLVDYSKTSPAINAALFPNTPSSNFPRTPSSNFWSGSPEAGYSPNAWFVRFSYGEAYNYYRSSYNAVRLVRGGQCFGPLALGISTTGAGQVTNRVSTGFSCDPAASGHYVGDVVTLTASPATNLIAWGGACASFGSAATCTVTMDAAKSVSASFKVIPELVGLSQGWNLLGNGLDQPIAVASLFGDAAKVTTVWKWDVLTSGWQFYAPSMDATTLQTYATSKGYGVLSNINAGEGFWVNAAQAFSASQPSGNAITASAFQPGQARALNTGWNLVAFGNATSASDFNLALSATPPATGTTPINVTSLWAWDNPLSKWYFYSPSLDGQGGSVLLDYTASKGYLDFVATGKLLAPRVGFWVNKL